MDRPYWDAELETLSWAEVERWQASQLAPWLRALPARSAFHHDLLAGVEVPEQPRDLRFLAGLPTTTKDEVRASQAEGGPGRPFGRHQGVALGDVVQTVSSSGTTGVPVFYALTSRDVEVWGDGIATGFYTAGVRPDDVLAHLVGLPGVAGGWSYADGFRRIGATVAWLGGLPTERIIRALPLLQVTAVLATTSFGSYLADRSVELVGADASVLGLRKLVAGGEPGLGQPAIRAKIKAGLGIEHVRETMGLGDVLSLLWAECDDEGGMHFCGQRSVAVELVDPRTDEQLPWEEGAEGEAVYTTFAREATPMLRFRSADHLVVSAGACPCGRTSPRVRCVGRTDDMLIYKGMNVFPTAIRDVVLDRFSGSVEPHLRIWKDTPGQVRYDDPLQVDIEASDTLEAEAYARVAADIERAVRDELQVRVAVSLVARGELPRSAYKNPLVDVREQPAKS